MYEKRKKNSKKKKKREEWPTTRRGQRPRVVQRSSRTRPSFHVYPCSTDSLDRAIVRSTWPTSSYDQYTVWNIVRTYFGIGSVRPTSIHDPDRLFHPASSFCARSLRMLPRFVPNEWIRSIGIYTSKSFIASDVSHKIQELEKIAATSGNTSVKKLSTQRKLFTMDTCIVFISNESCCTIIY